MGGMFSVAHAETLRKALRKAILIIEEGYELGLTDIREFSIYSPEQEGEDWRVEWIQHA